MQIFDKLTTTLKSIAVQSQETHSEYADLFARAIAQLSTGGAQSEEGQSRELRTLKHTIQALNQVDASVQSPAISDVIGGLTVRFELLKKGSACLDWLAPGASSEQLEELQAITSIPLPLSVIELLKMHNGCKPGHTAYFYQSDLSFHGVQTIIREWKLLKEFNKKAAAFLPILSNGGNSWLLFLGEGYKRYSPGELLVFNHEDSKLGRLRPALYVDLLTLVEFMQFSDDNCWGPTTRNYLDAVVACDTEIDSGDILKSVSTIFNADSEGVREAAICDYVDGSLWRYREKTIQRMLELEMYSEAHSWLSRLLAEDLTGKSSRLWKFLPVLHAHSPVSELELQSLREDFESDVLTWQWSKSGNIPSAPICELFGTIPIATWVLNGLEKSVEQIEKTGEANNLGMFFYYSGDLPKSLIAYDHAFSISSKTPESCLYLNNSAESCFDMEDYEQCLTYSDKSLQLSPIASNETGAEYKLLALKKLDPKRAKVFLAEVCSADKSLGEQLANK